MSMSSYGKKQANDSKFVIYSKIYKARKVDGNADKSRKDKQTNRQSEEKRQAGKDRHKLTDENVQTDRETDKQAQINRQTNSR